jgi:hypothetical protein
MDGFESIYLYPHTHIYIYIYIYGYKYIWKKIPQFPTYQIYGLLSLSKFSFLLDYTIKTAEQIIWFHNELLTHRIASSYFLNCGSFYSR